MSTTFFPRINQREKHTHTYADGESVKTPPCIGSRWFVSADFNTAPRSPRRSKGRCVGPSAACGALRNCANMQKVVAPPNAPPHPKTAQLTSCYPIRLSGHSHRCIRVRLFCCHGCTGKRRLKRDTRKQLSLVVRRGPQPGSW